MSLRSHVEEVLRITPVPKPWPRMVVCAIATAVPLIVGLLNHHLPLAIFGSLMGFLLPLNDHLGANLGHRLWTLTLTFLILMAGLSLGVMTQGYRVLFIPLLLALTYWLGLMGGGKGAELERAVLFAVFQFLAGAYSPHIGDYFWLLLSYAFLGYLCVVSVLSALVILRRHTPSPFAGLRASFKQSLTTNKDAHYYAISYSLVILASLIFVDTFKIDHGYWAVGTVLIIMRPDLKQGIYRAIQRFIGTLVGVLVADLIIYSVHSPWLAIAILAFVSFWGPWSLARSYWLGSAVITVMLLIILDMPSINQGDLKTPLLRLTATGIGCLLAFAGLLAINTPRFIKKRFL